MPRSDLPRHTSSSQLSTYAACPRSYAYRYLERREPESRSPGVALGSAVHSAIAWWFEERAQGRDVGISDVLPILRADLAAATSGDPMRCGETTPEELGAEATRLVGIFLENHGELEVKETEVRFDFVITDPDTGEQSPRPLLGYFGVELGSGNVVALEATRSAYSAVGLRADLQLGAYRTAALYLGVDVELYALVRSPAPHIQHVVLSQDREVSRWFMSAAASIERAILAGHFPPAPGATCARCHYRRACLGAEAALVEADDAEAA